MGAELFKLHLAHIAVSYRQESNDKGSHLDNRLSKDRHGRKRTSLQIVECRDVTPKQKLTPKHRNKQNDQQRADWPRNKLWPLVL